jgi:hypothetical protein|tara:strand:+ start:14953 stop:15633 length:681 start_codon:yes stop_codon:yes gene_type:complete
MKLSESTINVLKSFSLVNKSIAFKPGTTLSTISPQKSIMAKAEIEDMFPSEGCFYDLVRFISVLSLFDRPELTFHQKYVTVSDSKSSVNYTFSDPSQIITPPEKELTLPSEDVKVTIKSSDLINTIKAASVLGLPELAIASDGNTISLEAMDSKNPTADRYNVVLDSNPDNTVFKAMFKIETLRMMSYDYDVTISSKGIAKFESTTNEPKVTYWLAMEEKSTFEKV